MSFMAEYFISTNKSLLNNEKICSLLQDCFWSKNIPIEYVKRFILYSLCFGAYQQNNNEQVGFGRVITDYTTYAYVCDVVIDPLHRQKGLGSQLVEKMMSHPDLQGLKTWNLRTTGEAKNIYMKKGFIVVENPGSFLEMDNLSIYSQQNFKNLYL